MISILVLFLVSLIVYCIMRLMPTSYIESIARKRAEQPGSTRTYQDWLDQLKAVYGMNDNIIMGFFRWVGNALRGNFGDSWLYGLPVTQKFASVIIDTVWLVGTATLFEWLIGIPLGMLAAHKQYSKTDYAITVFALIGISLPTFFLGTLLKLFLAVKLGWFEPYGKVGRFYLSLTPFQQAMDVAKHYVLPVITLVIASIGSIMRYTRTNMLEVLNADYIRTARAKGLPERMVVTRHAFRNTLIPVVTLIGGLLPALFSGALITESVFQIPGIGYTFYQAVVAGDIPFSMFFLIFVAAMTLIGTLLADILYAVADPRVRIS